MEFFSSEYFINLLGLVGMLTVVALVMVLIFKIQRLAELEETTKNLQKSLNEMDEQAKLIVRTDLELNKTQEELDKKITGLYALQKISRAISMTLEESQIFQRIEPQDLEDIGFSKALAFLWSDAEKKFLPYLHIGYTQEELVAIQSFVAQNQEVFQRIIANEKTISSISLPETLTLEELKRAFQANAFLICAIVPKQKNKGFFFVGEDATGTVITEGDEELITILARHIGQALENARLFEETWRAQQDLEKKVEERTAELRGALEEVKLVSKRKSDFVSSVSHELRTPLTSIKGYASILLGGKWGSLPEEMRERLERINRHSDELVHLVNELLDISRIEAGKVAMKQEPQSLKTILEKALDLLSVQLKGKQLSVNVRITQDADSVNVDAAQIERVFINLIGNAIKFTPANGTITVQSQKTDNLLQVDISDTGCGIPQEAQEAIFEEFYRVDNLINQQLKGSGLGLSLVKQIIEAHQGKIWVKSKAQEGSTFSFTLPVAS